MDAYDIGICGSLTGGWIAGFMFLFYSYCVCGLFCMALGRMLLILWSW